jgi:uncharacterized RDD family membrane protein YckC
VLADVPDRAVALALDGVILAGAGLLLSVVLGGLLGGVVSAPTLDSSGGDLAIAPFVVLLLATLGVSLAYFSLTWTRAGATAGMRLLGLGVVDESGGARLSTRQALLRWAVAGTPATLAVTPVYVPHPVAILLAIVAIAVLGGLAVTVAQSPTRQGVHDRAAGSIVVMVSRRR